MDVEPLYSIPRTAELLDVHRATVYRLIQAGELDVVELGSTRSKMRVPAGSLRAYIEARRHEALNAKAVA